MEIFTKDAYTYQRWQIGASTFTACMELGARLLRWELALSTGTRQVIYWPEDADMPDIANVRGGNPILFPFMGRNYADGKKFFWKTPDGKVLPMPQHGFARQGKFAITHNGPDFVEVTFQPGADVKAGYPYDYTFTVRYKFRELGLECDLSLTNNGTSEIPWCAGHHFYFGLPWHAELGREDYAINIPAKKTWRLSADGKLVPFPGVEHPTTFANPDLPDLIHTKLKSNTATFGPKSGEENITIRIGEESVPDEWTTLVTWTAAPESPFYCVEPWMGPPNSQEHKNGLRWVAPGKTEKFTIAVSLDS